MASKRVGDAAGQPLANATLPRAAEDAHRPRLSGPVLAGPSIPRVQRLGVGAPHTAEHGDRPEPSQIREVSRSEQRDVFDSVPPSTRRFGIGSLGVGLYASRAMRTARSPRLERHLPAPGIEHPNELVQRVGSDRGVARGSPRDPDGSSKAASEDSTGPSSVILAPPTLKSGSSGYCWRGLEPAEVLSRVCSLTPTDE